MKNTTVLRAIIVLVTGLEACGDGTAAPPLRPPPNNALVLSEPVASTGVSPASSVTMVPRSILSGPVVFLSLGPGTASEGTTATVQNVTTGLQVDALLGGGGLDPIPLAASIGDSLSVTVPLSTGAPRLPERTRALLSSGAHERGDPRSSRSGLPPGGGRPALGARGQQQIFDERIETSLIESK